MPTGDTSDIAISEAKSKDWVPTRTKNSSFICIYIRKLSFSNHARLYASIIFIFSSFLDD